LANIGDEMGDVVIDFDNVSFSYGTQTEGSLRNINFKVKEGEFILLTGQSGSGKTTVTRLINGLIPHFFEGVLTGTVKVLGSDIKTITPGEMGKKLLLYFKIHEVNFLQRIVPRKWHLLLKIME
jgi:hypothetical protein